MTSAIWLQLRHLRVNAAAGLMFTVVSIIALPFGDLLPTDDFLDIVLELTLGLIATIAFWLVFLPALWFSEKFAGEGWVRFAVLLFGLVLGGAVRGACIFVLSENFMFESAAGFWQRTANSLSTTLLWLLVFSLFSSAADAFQRRYQNLFGQLAVIRASRVSGSEVERIFSSLEAGIREISDVSIDESKAKAEMERIARALERDIVGKIKSHSKTLWSFSNQAVPKLRTLPLFRLAVARLDYPLGFVIALFGTLSLLNMGSTVGFDEAAWRVALSLAVLAALDLVYRRAIRPRLRKPQAANLTYLICSGISVQFPLGLAGYLLEQSAAPAAFIFISAISAPLLMVLLSVLNLANLARRDLLDELLLFGEKLPDSNLDGSSATTELASFLHNSLQSEIQSIILSLKNDASELSVGRSSLERLRLLSSRSLDEDFAKFATLPREHLDLVIQGWSGILEISVDWEVAPELSDDSRVATVIQIIEEVASNSAVHGQATTMTARVRSEANHFIVEISNNATEQAPLDDRGLGSRWLKSFEVPADQLPTSGSNFRRIFRITA